MTKIYTRTGDDGYTDRPGGERVRKFDPPVEAVGEVDELNSVIGWALRSAIDGGHEQVAEALAPLQTELLTVGAMLAAAGTGLTPGVSVGDAEVVRMETHIDHAMNHLPALANFISPGGCEAACRLHVARTVCRRAERAVARAASVETRIPHEVFKYLNRLGDLLFALARQANADAGLANDVWKPGHRRGEPERP
jgi:cob(I)alamin adenosyltransferase